MHPQPPAQEIRRKPSPGVLSAHGPGGPYNPGAGFQGQIRPNSIHTLNSGNPQELATGGYESPIDNRHSYPSAQATAPSAPGPIAYDAYAPQQQQQQQLTPAPLKTRTDRDALPSRQRTQSFESPSSSYYSQQQPEATDAPPPEPQQPPPMQPSAPPPGVPGSPDDGMRNAAAHAPYQQPYQAYRPQEQRVPSGGGDPGDFYRYWYAKNASAPPTTISAYTPTPRPPALAEPDFIALACGAEDFAGGSFACRVELSFSGARSFMEEGGAERVGRTGDGRAEEGGNRMNGDVPLSSRCPPRVPRGSHAPRRCGPRPRRPRWRPGRRHRVRLPHRHYMEAKRRLVSRDASRVERMTCWQEEIGMLLPGKRCTRERQGIGLPRSRADG
nr:hypothetical protein CFP56_53644 [Quercus suber]